jgi:cysteine-rich repeat protein
MRTALKYLSQFAGISLTLISFVSAAQAQSISTSGGDPQCGNCINSSYCTAATSQNFGAEMTLTANGFTSGDPNWSVSCTDGWGAYSADTTSPSSTYTFQTPTIGSPGSSGSLGYTPDSPSSSPWYDSSVCTVTATNGTETATETYYVRRDQTLFNYVSCDDTGSSTGLRWDHWWITCPPIEDVRITPYDYNNNPVGSSYSAYDNYSSDFGGYTTGLIQNAHIYQFDLYGQGSVLLDSQTVTCTCGDGNLDTDKGEECDDGNNNDGDGCSSTCRIPCTPTNGTWQRSSYPSPSTCPVACEQTYTYQCVGATCGGTCSGTKPVDEYVSCTGGHCVSTCTDTPTIDTLTATPDSVPTAGGTVNLAWTTTNVSEVRILGRATSTLARIANPGGGTSLMQILFDHLAADGNQDVDVASPPQTFQLVGIPTDSSCSLVRQNIIIDEAAAPGTITLTANPLTIDLSGASLTSTLTAQLSQNYPGGLSGRTINFFLRNADVAPNGTFSSPTATTNASGTATITLTAPSTEGFDLVRARENQTYSNGQDIEYINAPANDLNLSLRLPLEGRISTLNGEHGTHRLSGIQIKLFNSNLSADPVIITAQSDDTGLVTDTLTGESIPNNEVVTVSVKTHQHLRRNFSGVVQNGTLSIDLSDPSTYEELANNNIRGKAFLPAGDIEGGPQSAGIERDNIVDAIDVGAWIYDFNTNYGQNICTQARAAALWSDLDGNCYVGAEDLSLIIRNDSVHGDPAALPASAPPTNIPSSTM